MQVLVVPLEHSLATAGKYGPWIGDAFGNQYWNYDGDYGSMSFTQHVPGPLPILGVVAAFGWSRKLRNRIKAAKAVGR